MIAYENPATADGLGTWWCHTCNRGMGYLSDSLTEIYNSARSHNNTEHDDALTVRCTDTNRGVRDFEVAALAREGMSDLAIAHAVGLRDAFNARRIRERLGLAA